MTDIDALIASLETDDLVHYGDGRACSLCEAADALRELQAENERLTKLVYVLTYLNAPDDGTDFEAQRIGREIAQRLKVDAKDIQNE